MKKLLILSIATVLSLPAIGCKRSEENEWKITRETYEKILELDSYIEKENDQLVYKFDSNNEFFAPGITPKDVILYNKDTLTPINNEKYYSYKAYKNSEVKINSIVEGENGKAFTTYFNGNKDTHYGIIVNKNKCVVDQYIISNAEKSYNESYLIGTTDEDQEYEKWVNDYIHKCSAYDETQEFLDMAKYWGEIVVGLLSDCPTSAVDGLFGIISMFAGLENTEPSTIDIFNKLVDIDHKLDVISEQIEKNQEVLVKEDLFIEAQIDKALIQLFKQDYSNYVTNYVEPLETIERDYNQYIGFNLKQMVKNSIQPAKLHYKVSDKGYELLSQYDKDYDANGTRIIEIEVPAYPNAQKFLIDHNDVVSKGFVDAFYKDLENAVQRAIDLGTIEINDKISKDIYKKHLYEATLDKFEKERYQGDYGTDQYKDAQNIETKAINIANRVAGSHGVDSIIDSFIERIRCMFNFQKEAREIVRGFLANIKMTVEKYVGMASIACSYAKISHSALNDAYQDAIDTIQMYANANDEIEDNYSFILNTKLTSNFVKSIYDISYSNPGNDCVFHKELVWRQVTKFYEDGISGPQFEKLNISEKHLIGYVNQQKIVSRRNIMAQTGYDVSSDYIKYLRDNGAIKYSDYKMRSRMYDSNWIGNDTYRILTEYNGQKAIDGSEKITYTCMACGNPDGYYFRQGTTYSWKGGNRNADCWSGQKAIGTFIDGNSGVKQANDIISAYAKYDERHGYWIDDEFWAFQNNIHGDYFFMIVTE